MKARRYQSGLTIVELMVTLILASFVVAGVYRFVNQQRTTSRTQKLKADTESMAQIAFFIIGRDIRRAGSNPKGAMGYTSGVEIPIGIAQNSQIQIYADLNGDGDVSDTDEDITYQWVDSDDPDTLPDEILRQGGSTLVIENIRLFDIQYQLVGTTTWVTSTTSPELIRLVRLHMKAGTGKINPSTNVEDVKELQMDFMLRNFR